MDINQQLHVHGLNWTVSTPKIIWPRQQETPTCYSVRVVNSYDTLQIPQIMAFMTDNGHLTECRLDLSSLHATYGSPRSSQGKHHHLFFIMTLMIAQLLEGIRAIFATESKKVMSSSGN
jgi:hypothetical protein